ncbi:MAG TPA: rod shape-determining protein MreC [Patescibacteria group bacterium]|nr:rod shape-determining protein MreC [Patescibacteria group bacterium]
MNSRPKLGFILAIFFLVVLQYAPPISQYRHKYGNTFLQHFDSIHSIIFTTLSAAVNPWKSALAAQRENEILELQNRALSSQLASYQSATFSATMKKDNQTFGFAYIPHRSLLFAGSNEGIRQDMSVLSQGAFIGIISSVRSEISDVVLLADGDMQIALQYPRIQKSAILRKEGSRYIARFFSKIDVTAGDFLMTLGDGEKIPPGVPVGTIISDETAPADPYSVVSVRLLSVGQDSQFVNLRSIR